MGQHVVIINGSPRRGTTLQYLTQIEDILKQSGFSTSMLNLVDCTISDCTGCEQCIRKTTWCVQKDDASAILEDALRADGIVIASPVYVGTVTGKLKSLLDKTASWLHRPPAVGKPVLPVVTTAGSGQRRTLSYLTEVATYWGAHPVSGISRTASRRDEITAEEVRPFIAHLRMDRSRYRPSLRQVMMFSVQKVLALRVAEIDRRFWAQKGWIDKPYYYRCRISPHKRLIGRLLFFILMRRIKPVNAF